jgi:Fe-S-cluster-containing dehydrogenase component
MKVFEEERGTLPKVKTTWMPVLCMHCENAPCIPGCPEHAIDRRADGIVLIDPQKCNGCKDCLQACPYGVIYFNEELNLCQKCTLCAHLLDQGWDEPRCVTACPTEALIFGEADELRPWLELAEPWKPETGAQPTVKYLNLPKPFVAGEVCSPSENVCLEGVQVTLTNLLTGESLRVQTDNYGDFWLRGVKPGGHTLLFEKDGYYSKQIQPLWVEGDLNLGPVKLYRVHQPVPST